MKELLRQAIKQKMHTTLSVEKLTASKRREYKDEFLSLVEEFIGEENPGDSPDRFIKQGEGYLLLEDKKPVGFITYKNMKGDYCHICSFAVTKLARGKGYGRFFLNWFIKEKAGHRLGLGVNPENEIAKKLYTSLGFKVVDSGVEDGMPFELMRR